MSEVRYVSVCPANDWCLENICQTKFDEDMSKLHSRRLYTHDAQQHPLCDEMTQRRVIRKTGSTYNASQRRDASGPSSHSYSQQGRKIILWRRLAVLFANCETCARTNTNADRHTDMLIAILGTPRLGRTKIHHLYKSTD